MRCSWAKGELLERYHDEEWGVPTRDEQKLYEMLLLEAFQAGLSWYVVLSKRENFRKAFDGFDARKIAAYDDAKIDELVKDEGLIRCRRKMAGAVSNAQVYLRIVEEFGSFAAYLDRFTGGRIIVNQTGEALTTSPLSDAISKDLRRRGMKYMGSVTVYSYLQAVGVINDHEKECFMRTETNTTLVFAALREYPHWKEAAAAWFSSKWGVPQEAYLECMNDYLENRTEYGWYLCIHQEQIVGGLGVIENDFHDRRDLSPNICAIFTEPAFRKQGIAGKLLSMAVDDLKSKGISPVYLLTDHTGFYERYGWEFLCMAQGDGEEQMSRMYIHR